MSKRNRSDFILETLSSIRNNEGEECELKIQIIDVVTKRKKMRKDITNALWETFAFKTKDLLLSVMGDHDFRDYIEAITSIELVSTRPYNMQIYIHMDNCVCKFGVFSSSKCIVLMEGAEYTVSTQYKRCVDIKKTKETKKIATKVNKMVQFLNWLGSSCVIKNDETPIRFFYGELLKLQKDPFLLVNLTY